MTRLAYAVIRTLTAITWPFARTTRADVIAEAETYRVETARW